MTSDWAVWTWIPEVHLYRGLANGGTESRWRVCCLQNNLFDVIPNMRFASFHTRSPMPKLSSISRVRAWKLESHLAEGSVLSCCKDQLTRRLVPKIPYRFVCLRSWLRGRVSRARVRASAQLGQLLRQAHQLEMPCSVLLVAEFLRYHLPDISR